MIPDKKFLYLTTVTDDNRPWTVPVWYVIDGDDLIIYSAANSRHVSNIRQRPQICVHFGADESGHDFVEYRALATVDTADAAQQPGFTDKYASDIEAFGIPIEKYKDVYPIRIRLELSGRFER